MSADDSQKALLQKGDVKGTEERAGRRKGFSCLLRKDALQHVYVLFGSDTVKREN